MPRLSKSVCITAVLFVLAGCNRKQEAATPAASPVVQCVPPSDLDFLKKPFSMRDFKSFELLVPAHCNSPRLYGDFRSSLSADQGSNSSDETANLDVFLLDEKQFNTFQGSSDGAMQSIQNTGGHEIDWTLPSAPERLQKFYILFRDSSGEAKSKVVEPNLTLSME